MAHSLEADELDLNLRLPACPVLCLSDLRARVCVCLYVCTCVYMCVHVYTCMYMYVYVSCMMYWGGVGSSLWIRVSPMLTKFEQKKGGHYAIVRKGMASASCVTLG